MQHLVVQVNGQEVPFQVSTIIDGQEVLANLAVVSKIAQDYAKNSRSKNTMKSYSSDWKDFDFWCLKEMVESVIYSDCAAAVTTTKTQAARGAKNTCNSEVLPGWGQVVMALNNIPKRWTMPV